MTEVALSPSSRGKRIYHFGTPFHVPGMLVGMAVARAKQLGVWEKAPRGLRQKVKAAMSSWSGVAITETDLDSIPDDDWKIIAARLNLKWEIR
jgi:hypothetical protein